MKSDPSWLEKMRLVGDPPVDDVIAQRLDDDSGQLGPLMRDLFHSSGMPENQPLVAAYLRAIPPDDLGDPATLRRGQRLFEIFGPEILLTLGSYSLPLVYASGHGVQAIYRARRLKEDPARRLCDTAQMVINCVEPNGLSPGGIGWLSTRKVRLMHALVRYQLRTNAVEPWSLAWGIPVNQEDQAGTLLTFSAAALDGLRKMGATVSPEDASAYVSLWSAIGRLLGVDASLLPWTEKDAVELALKIGARQLRPTPEGQHLNEQLLAVMSSLFPFPGYALSLNHFFLANSVFGANVATLLRIPEPNWTKWLVGARATQTRRIFQIMELVPGGRRRRSLVASRFAQAMLLMMRPDGSVPFALPERLLTYWPVRSR